MKRRIMVDYAEASPEVRAIYDEVKKVTSAPEIPNFLRALGANENVLRATWATLRYTVLTGDVPLLLKQLILFNISFRAGNRYCAALHGHAALELDKTLTCEDSLYCASAQLNEVFMHVLRNAIEAIDGDGTITITTGMAERNIRVRIADTGSGMPPEVVRRIFDFGFREEARVRMGCGLFLAHKIVHDHGGHIEVESEPGRGTSVMICLPAVDRSDCAEERSAVP